MHLKSRKAHPPKVSVLSMEVSTINYQTGKIETMSQWWTRQRNPENKKRCHLSPTLSWVFTIFPNKLTISTPKTIKIQFLSLPKTMEITQVFFTPSIKRREKIQIAIWLEQNRDCCQESNKMSTNKWSRNSKNLRKIMCQSEEIWTLTSTKIKFWQKDWKSWRSSSTTIKASWKTKRKSRRRRKRSMKLNKKLKKLSTSMPTPSLSMKDWMFWSKSAEEIKPTMKRPFLISSLNATTSKRWSKPKVNQFSNSRKKSMRWRNLQRNLLPTVAKKYKTKIICKKKFNKLWETGRISKAK